MTQGEIEFRDSETEAEIDIELLRNNVPSEAMVFKLRLTAIQGGGRLKMQNDGELPSLNVIVKDSDDVYGIVEFEDTPPNIVMVGLLQTF